MAVTIKDVAALAGVSPSTVSRTCKNNPYCMERSRGYPCRDYQRKEENYGKTIRTIVYGQGSGKGS